MSGAVGADMLADILAGLDAERRALGTPSPDGHVVVERSADGSDYRIVFADGPPAEIDDVIRRERAAADTGGYAVEWKVYGHDRPADLPDRLVAAGFEADDVEDVLVLALDTPSLAAFGTSSHDIRVVHDDQGLADYAEISREIGRRNVDAERTALAVALREYPDELSVHIAYVDGEPASCGRVLYRPGGPYAELAGGRTKTTHRRQGLFTALVASRLREARERGRTHAFVDALPTSGPTLRRRGFQSITWTRPYVYEPPR